MTQANKWFQQIKDVRLEHGVDLAEAERMVLADPRWRRWVERRINADAGCRRVALAHMRVRGADALIKFEGSKLIVSFADRANRRRCS